MLINVVVKYLAQARPAAGASEERVALHETASIKDLLNKLADTHGHPLRELLLTSEGQSMSLHEARLKNLPQSVDVPDLIEQ